jgi:hypothetical protein
MVEENGQQNAAPVTDIKPADAKEVSPKQMMETGFLVMIPNGGAAVVGDLDWKSAANIQIARPATFDDMYRLVCDLKQVLESMRNYQMWEGKLKEKAVRQAMENAQKGPELVKP